MVCAGNAEDNAGQLGGNRGFVLAAEPGHVWQIHVRTLVHGHSQRLNRSLSVLNRAVRLDGTLGEHVRLALYPAIFVQNLQRAQEVVARVRVKRALVFAGGNEAVFCGESVVQLVQPPLLCGDYPLTCVHRL